MRCFERVSVSEAIKLFDYQTIEAFWYVKEIVKTVAQEQAEKYPTQDATFNLMYGAFAAWEAGRLAGIRSERVRRNPERRERELKETEFINNLKGLDDERCEQLLKVITLLTDGPTAFKEELTAISEQSGPIWGDIKTLLDKWEQNAEREAS